MNWLHSFYCVGAAVTILIGAISENTGFGWRGACLVLATLPLILIFWFGVLAFPPMTQEGGTRQRTRTLLRERWFNLALLALFLGGATELGMAQWLPAYAETHLGYSKTVSSTALLLFSVAMAVGRMIIGAAGRKWSSFTIMSAACASSAVLFVLGCFLPLPLPALISCIVVGFTGSCLWPTMLAVSADRYPNGGATMFGALAAFGNAGGIFMPWLVGVVADHSDLRWGIVTGAIAPLSMLLVLRALRRGAPATSVSPVVVAPPAL
jgi:fucose permease